MNQSHKSTKAKSSHIIQQDFPSYGPNPKAILYCSVVVPYAIDKKKAKVIMQDIKRYNAP